MITSAKIKRIPSHRLQVKLSSFLNHLLVGAVSLVTIAPVIIIISGSLSAANAIKSFGYRPWIQEFTLEAYRYIFLEPTQVLKSYGVSFAVTAIGTLVGLSITAMMAYALSRKKFRLRGILFFLIFFTLLFRGGTVPLYIIVSKVLGLKNTLWALILPGLTNPFYILLLSAFFGGIPSEFYDAAEVDGASEFAIFRYVAIPLAAPMLATIGMFYILQYWNDWFTPLLFITNPDLTPLQFLLQRMMQSMTFLQQNMTNLASTAAAPFPTESIRMAMAVIAAGPMTIVFLFFQRFFIRGLIQGGLKG